MDDMQELRTILQQYKQHGFREMPWRSIDANGLIDPYKILVSEIMLQQTQVSRVISKYTAFVHAYPTAAALAKAPLADVLTLWSGLGYNRRARYLHMAAQVITNEMSGKFPQSIEDLVTLPGVGKNTAGAIQAYAYNLPARYIETNIRTVLIHHFHRDQVDVSDSQLLNDLEQIIDTQNPRTFYWALMDYGTHLKKVSGNASRKSKTYKKQSKFEGSRRQVRGAVLRALSQGKKTHHQLDELIRDERLTGVLEDLQRDGLITQAKKRYQLG